MAVAPGRIWMTLEMGLEAKTELHFTGQILVYPIMEDVTLMPFVLALLVLQVVHVATGTKAMGLPVIVSNCRLRISLTGLKIAAAYQVVKDKN